MKNSLGLLLRIESRPNLISGTKFRDEMVKETPVYLTGRTVSQSSEHFTLTIIKV